MSFCTILARRKDTHTFWINQHFVPIIHKFYLPLSIVFENEFQGYVSTQEGKILKTTNRGQSWEIVYENNEPIVKIIKTPNSIFGVGGNGLVVKSK